MATEVQLRGATCEGGIDQEMPSLVLSSPSGAGAGALHGAPVGQRLLELDDSGDDAGGAGGSRIRGRIRGATPVHDQRNAGKGSGEALDGVDVKGEAAVEAALARDLGKRLLYRVPSPQRRSFLLLLALRGRRRGRHGGGRRGGFGLGTSARDRATFVGGGKWREASTSLSGRVEGAAFDLVEKSKVLTVAGGDGNATRVRLAVAIVGGIPPYHGDEEEEEKVEELRPISFSHLRQLLLFLGGRRWISCSSIFFWSIPFEMNYLNGMKSGR